ncbi:MAG: Gfo/Idh/MocA family protein [Anaerolineae bacterium]|jgi:predicted dehydrogenase
MAFRAGIIGTGGIARAHVNGYRENGVQVTALMDVNRAAAEAMAANVEGAQIFDTYAGLLDSGLVDVVSICTPPVAHEEPAVMALERGIHVMLEKPMAHTVESGRRILEAAEKSGAVLTIGFRHRFLPAIQKLRELVQDGTLGPVVLYQNAFTGPAFQMKDRWFSKKAISGGGTLMDTSIHSVDIFRFIVGEIAEQRALTAHHLEGTDVEDASMLLVKSESGAIGCLSASWVAGDGQSFVEVVGQNGRALFDYTVGDQVRLRRRGEKEWEIIEVRPSAGFVEEIERFLAAIRGEQELLVTAQDGLRALEIVQSCY